MPTPNVVTPAVEAEMLRLWLQGKTQREIADQIGIHYTTVTAHLRRILQVETPEWKGAGRIALRRLHAPQPLAAPVQYPENPKPLRTPCELVPGEAQRFWGHVTPPNATGCRLWLLSTTPFGHGQVGVASANKVEGAHRVAWRLTYGPVPEDKDVLHRCDVAPCVEPTHLWLGTQADNMHDMAAKGRRRGRPGRQGEDNATAKLTWELVRQMRHVRETKGLTLDEISKRFKISKAQASNICAYRQWIE